MKKDNPRHGGTRIIIYTDGAARGNPGPAGWASVLIDEKEIFEIGGASKHATNNQMELTAPIEALKYLKQKNTQGSPVEIFSDSKYVILGITEWIFNWQKNNWRNAAKKPVLNKELWEELYELSQKFKIKWTYVEGHMGNKYNERADEIATNFADGIKMKLRKEK
ncbi:ribonuclease HI [Candidatus Nomurabacteria bacterium CG_4_9_14_0_2_um_filter_32_10]|uniref:Ribonuclease H n=3 Tax=Candidatus Nomuraibacteriota TaxID=1752729 RepID=A0A2H0CFS4_9BACT|nr:MAG: ribonuclease HI [Candidatus Nomurabacteria bacterium CG22_combo_CG10-13_8_21_14_all_32_8]PIZ85400.1 MAG: ribonuclease HI [Candidatus Nomurabacteria bacterium CG_4_10_14_0_2_um_filter_33_9]PJC49566.1 MAG: ribonuclease HI [Candidatus Nomurabacteria bacterium CG_4_9_14_0_2_um_filter_32_10]